MAAFNVGAGLLSGVLVVTGSHLVQPFDNDYYTYGIYGFVTFVGPFHLRREFPLTCGRIQMLPQCLGEWYEEKMGVSSPLG